MLSYIWQAPMQQGATVLLDANFGHDSCDALVWKHTLQLNSAC
jgi:hypothetical protein